MADNANPMSTRALIDLYRRSFAEHGDSPSAVLWPRGRQDKRFGALTSHFRQTGFSVLDFGCGLAHLKSFLESRFSDFLYTGVDIVPEFISAAKVKYPASTFSLIRSDEEISLRADYVVASGTFNLIHGMDEAAHRASIRKTIARLFSICDVSLSVDFMTDRVDYRQSNSYHENVEDIYRFVSQELSPRLTIDQSYMPYEFTIVAFKDSNIVRPDNVYGAAQ